jgi:acetyl esterase
MLDNLPQVFEAPGPGTELVQNRTFQGGESSVNARLYRTPNWTINSGVLLFLHGGGHVLGSLESHDRLCRKITNAGGMMVCAVDYRLAPEHKFPRGLEDCIAAYRWLLDEVTGLGFPPAKVAIGGDSAGGNLAAAMLQVIQERELPIPSLQVLIYPGLSYIKTTQSMHDFGSGYFLTLEDIKFFRDAYLGDESLWSDYRASPLEAVNLSGLPRTMIHTAACDPLRDHGALYADRLSSAGVDVCYTEHPGMLHGFFNFTGRSIYADRAVVKLSRDIGLHLNASAVEDFTR